MPGSNTAESLGGQSPVSFLVAYRQLPLELRYLSVLENNKVKIPTCLYKQKWLLHLQVSHQ
jgi:hypothetical protein